MASGDGVTEVGLSSVGDPYRKCLKSSLPAHCITAAICTKLQLGARFADTAKTIGFYRHRCSRGAVAGNFTTFNGFFSMTGCTPAAGRHGARVSSTYRPHPPTYRWTKWRVCHRVFSASQSAAVISFWLFRRRAPCRWLTFVLRSSDRFHVFPAHWAQTTDFIFEFICRAPWLVSIKHFIFLIIIG